MKLQIPSAKVLRACFKIGVFAEKAGWLRCSSVRDRCGYPPSSRLAIQPFPRKQDSHGILKQALRHFKHQAPNGGRAPVDVELATWSFFGGWMLVFGASQLCLRLI